MNPTTTICSTVIALAVLACCGFVPGFLVGGLVFHLVCALLGTWFYLMLR